MGRKLGKAQAPIRVAVTGRRVGPPLFESLVLLGRKRTLGRMQAALDRAGSAGGPAVPVAILGALAGLAPLRRILRLLVWLSWPSSSTWW